ncbi:MAG: glycosyltransferase family 2 protein [Promethearchaeota archaeon]
MTKNTLISIIIPVFNEEENIRELLFNVLEVDCNYLRKIHKWNTEIIIIDDGSTDNSSYIIEEISLKTPNIRIINHNGNKGKGSAISSALKRAEGQVCIIQDADLEYNPLEIPKLLEPIINGKYDVVFGSRFLNFQNYSGLWTHLAGNKILSLISSLFLQQQVTDIMTCYKAFRRDLIQNINSKSFDVEPEIAAKLLYKRNVRFKEIPISYNPRLKGKKIKKFHGIISLYRLVLTLLKIQYKEIFKNN